jgi:hypothetical protein
MHDMHRLTYDEKTMLRRFERIGPCGLSLSSDSLMESLLFYGLVRIHSDSVLTPNEKWFQITPLGRMALVTGQVAVPDSENTLPDREELIAALQEISHLAKGGLKESRLPLEDKVDGDTAILKHILAVSESVLARCQEAK